jgi:tetratricopeptide (TPR) repeat protein
MALCLRRAGDAKRALDVYRQYLVEAPDTPKRAAVEARIKELQQELEPAVKRGAKPAAASLASPTKDAATYEQEAKKLYEAGRWAEAASEFDGAYRIGRDSALLYNMALCHRRSGNAKRAFELYQRAAWATPAWT